ncbi:MULTISPECIES: PaaI family thioesterase [Tsukamurella]|uniref:PaaI family thioesterase n=2 Tax=Tsukamurella TaxID=2060 RepID=A0A5C5S428_9ACTN|nr:MULTISPECIES: PaaI family thioesterase [Tsukamurella]NMD55144.1 PaaI family thioesterase [Tsukamurella columbiensis]TWS30167.1 PaaI family thioesterase [Tsukamurella conjunctivitidis]
MTVSPDHLDAAVADGSEIMKQFVPASPFVALLGVQLEEITDGAATLLVPYRPELTTVGTMMHGGLIAAAADIGVMVAAWAGRPVPDKLRGVTASLSLNFIAPLMEDGLRVRAHRLSTGRRTSHVRCEMYSESGDALVASATGTYQVG